jgi:hypothetical protein
MNQLCVLTHLTSSDWAAWVQAIGSIVAIGIAVWVSHQQSKNSLNVIRVEHRLTRTELAKALLSLSTNCKQLLDHITAQFPDRETCHFIADGTNHFDFNELQVVEHAVSAIPLHNLPHRLISLTMMVSSTVRQFRENVQYMLHHYTKMDGAAFQKFFDTLEELRVSLEQTCKDIQGEVKRSESEV